MTMIAATTQSFFTERLTKQKQVSQHTVTAYRDTFRLLFGFVKNRTGKPPSLLTWDDLDIVTITAFLDHLETERHNNPRTRNARLTAIRSLFAYAALRHPEHGATIAHVLAIPPKRYVKPTVSFLTDTESAAILAAPDLTTWEGRRDRALMLLAMQTGLRVSELTNLNCSDASLGGGAHVRCEGKGRKQRSVPLTKNTENVLRVWITERNGNPTDPLFPTRTGKRLSRDAIEQRVNRHATTATTTCISLQTKKLSPHTFRHTSAMSLLHAGVDTTVIALWLGHADLRSTNPYLHADITIKERALALTTPTTTKPGRYKPTDKLLAFLEAL